MHHSRLCALLIDCQTSSLDEAALFWAQALGRPVDPQHPGTRENYRMLETPPDEPLVQIQRVEHESRVHIDIETDDIEAEVARLKAAGFELIGQAPRTGAGGHRVAFVHPRSAGGILVELSEHEHESGTR